ncbi:MAG: polysaccharide deacetylase family protein [Cypionkella sp.]|uniref:polysaccharide deacetylase family protein n=1 Tax=Cypionkella sp. TaxID=2811411 RepID=UPI002ABC5669|nr:polysaccharide deacetylase family protein [Cypionkella sp.]MDZ4310580.1 polysaccharide deacetylase family protein [Cypionkella sp.]
MTTSLIRALDLRAANGNPAKLWLRDDDATEPTAALDHLLSLTEAANVPVTLAVIPADSGATLAKRLDAAKAVSVAVHGWSHTNHAPVGEKKQELGPHRPIDQILAELARGFSHLAQLHPQQFTPVLVPPWNRIAPHIITELPALGFKALSVYGPEAATALPLYNTHVDVIDWRGSRSGRPDALLMDEIAHAMQRSDAPVGLLTHHLVHDAQVWGFLTRLFALTATHPGCRWVSLPDLIASP